ncbi:Isoprenylcysteine carboxyl methyltransferase (ICMT) family protein [Pirellulimonas nuda]|uniref:Isoprenylcysteine carboxyl methyltransferase (ICMT) family protein n=1 Tax=Pirellulimonas nuda TaxID=2528009 RepID=A0A518D7J5_9BACT|nr:isoprenylcysteine carboxylmethyltransferase family protein [Pirellulimonas nuda]QDU87452.1 Isoprenylcysteine carboxyl methyltransferase (ICMT) family protein [Pirellulimonas nuda]
MGQLEWMARGATLAALGLATVAFQYFAWRACRTEAVTPRHLLREEGAWFTVVFVLLTTLITLGVLGFATGAPWLAPTMIAMPAAVEAAGALLALAGAAGIAWTMATLRDNHTITTVTRAEHQLVTTGPYRWVRHPLYAFALLMCIGFTLATGSLLVAAATLAGLPLGRVRMEREEAALVERFGDRYKEFMARRGRLWPRAL